MFTKALALLLLPLLAAAQYGYNPSPGGSSSSSSSAPAPSVAASVAPTAPADTPGHMNVDVVFQKTLVFHPANITAAVGTLVTFWFPNFGINHSVTQSTFANPCTFLAANASTNTSAGFDSSLLSSSTFTINITDTNPIWYFCKQGIHCGQGMVGSINAPATGNTFDSYKAAALAIGSNVVQVPDNGPVISGVHATATGPPVAETSSPSGAMKVTTSIGFTLFAAVLGVAMA